MGDISEIQLGSLQATTPEALQRIANSEAVARNLRDMFPHPYTLDDARMFIENVKQGKMGYVYGIYRHFEELVGVISMTPGRDVNCCSAEVGYFIGEQYWNKGYATEALKMLPTIARLNFGLSVFTQRSSTLTKPPCAFSKRQDLRKKESSNPQPLKTGKSSTSICMPWLSDNFLIYVEFQTNIVITLWRRRKKLSNWS